MATAAQIALAAKRAADPSYQRALAAATKKGSTESISKLAGLGVTTQSVAAVSKAAPVAQIIDKTLTSRGSTMGAGSTYEVIDAALGGILPGGVKLNPGTTAAVAGAARFGLPAAGLALLATNYSSVDKLLGGVLPGGVAGADYKLGGRYVGKKKIRRYDYFNMKALRRADKRIDGFIKHSKKYISSTGYKIVRR